MAKLNKAGLQNWLGYFADDTAANNLATVLFGGPQGGMRYFNATTTREMFYDGSSWLEVAVAGAVGGLSNEITRWRPGTTTVDTFATLADALATAASGDVVKLGVGYYTLGASGVTIPSGVTVAGMERASAVQLRRFANVYRGSSERNVAVVLCR
jgi:hypothetical protein